MTWKGRERDFFSFNKLFLKSSLKCCPGGLGFKGQYLCCFFGDLKGGLDSR